MFKIQSKWLLEAYSIYKLIVYIQKGAIIFVKSQASCKYENGRIEMVKDNIKVLMDIK